MYQNLIHLYLLPLSETCSLSLSQLLFFHNNILSQKEMSDDMEDDIRQWHMRPTSPFHQQFFEISITLYLSVLHTEVCCNYEGQA